MKNIFKLNCYPWIVITFSSLFLFYKYILQVSPSVITHELMRRFHLDGVGMGNLAATFFYSYLIAQLFVGPLLDKLGSRFLTAFAIFLCATGAMWFAHANTFFQAAFARSIIGVGAAFATVSYLKVAAVWFEPKKYALVSGLLATAAMIGSMCGQFPFALLVIHFGWQASLYGTGLFGIMLAALFYFIVRVNPSSYFSEKEMTPLHFSDVISVVKSKINWYLMFYSGLAFSPLAVFGGLWGDSFLQTAYHVSKPDAAMLSSMSFLGLAVGAPLIGYISDCLSNRFSIIVFGLLLSIVALFVALYFPTVSRWSEGVSLFLFGFGTGAFMLVFVIGKDINPPMLTATIIAFINTGEAIIGTFTEPLLGKLLDIFGHGKMRDGIVYFTSKDYHLALILLPFYLLLALVFLLLSRRAIK